MDKRNENISGTFGKYNSADEFNSVSSKKWQPISEGRSEAAQSTSQPQQARGSSSNKKSGSKKGAAGHSLISQGNPAERQSPAPEKRAAPRAAADKKPQSKPPVKKSAPSRTPKGRDLRKDAREQQKHREEQFKVRENYNEQLKNQRNHDEISQQINKGKRTKYALKTGAKVGLAVFFAVLIVVGYALNRGALIETVIIEGNTVYAEEEIQQVAGVRPGKSLLLLREGRVRRVLTKKLPYITEVVMQRDFPNTVTLTLTTTTDRYVISGQSGGFTLDGNRKVVSEGAVEEKDGVYIAEGFDPQKAQAGDIYEPEGVNAVRFELLQKLAELFEKSGVVKTAVIELADTENVRVVVDGKIAVYFADCKNLEERVPFACSIIVDVRKAGKSGYIDMTNENGYFNSDSMTM